MHIQIILGTENEFSSMSNFRDLVKIAQEGLPEIITMLFGEKSAMKMRREFFIFSKLAE